MVTIQRRHLNSAALTTPGVGCKEKLTRMSRNGHFVQITNGPSYKPGPQHAHKGRQAPGRGLDHLGQVALLFQPFPAIRGALLGQQHVH